MGLVIRLHDITGFSTNYKVELKTGATPNSVTSWVPCLNNQTEDKILISGSVLEDNFNKFNSQYTWPNQKIPIENQLNEYNNLKFWVKITDNSTGNYVIENINIHEKEYYSDCMYCCEFDPYPTGSYISGF